MLKKLQGKCDLFIHNRQEMQKGFTWDYPAVKGLSAMLYTVCGQKVDINYIRTCRKMLRQELAATGYVEGQALISAATLLALSKDSVRRFQHMMKLYNMFVHSGFQASVYTLIIALNIAEYKDESQYEAIVERAADTYEKLMHNEWFAKLDLQQAYKEVCAVSFAEMDSEAYFEKTRKCYSILEEVLPTWGSIYVVTDALLINSSNAEKKCRYVIDIYNKLRQAGYEFREDFEYSVLGVLALVCDSTDRAVEDVITVCRYLESRSEFNQFNMQRDQYLTYAAMLVEAQYIEDIELGQYISEFVGDVFVTMNISIIVNMVENASSII